jgi:hypothetical protein
MRYLIDQFCSFRYYSIIRVDAEDEGPWV